VCHPLIAPQLGDDIPLRSPIAWRAATEDGAVAWLAEAQVATFRSAYLVAQFLGEF